VLNAQCYRNYLSRCKYQFAQDPKQFYNFVDTNRKTISYSSSLFFENTTVTIESGNSRSIRQVFSNNIFLRYLIPNSHTLMRYPSRI